MPSPRRPRPRALTVLRARSPERTPDPAVLADIRAQRGLSDSPLRLLAQWLGGLPHGDAGRSLISGAEVTPAVLQALGVSLLLEWGPPPRREPALRRTRPAPAALLALLGALAVTAAGGVRGRTPARTSRRADR